MHALALGDRELAEQEEGATRLGRDPIGIAATGIQEGRLRGPGGFLGQAYQLVLDLERAERLEFAKGQQFSHGFLPSGVRLRWTVAVAAYVTIRTMISPHRVSSVLLTA